MKHIHTTLRIKKKISSYFVFLSIENESGCQRSKFVITHLTDFFQREKKLSIDITLEKENQSTARFVHHHINNKKK